MSKLKDVLEASECHTLDRYNFRAQRDVCGIGEKPELDEAITAMFDVKYHPWVQDQTVKACIEDAFDDSLTNQKKMSGRYMRSMIQAMIGLTIFLVGILL